mmetsp:Transcript_20884/g.41645  ORF Transcript_20884/g.41645 Transcript_20884/m.41645 type:complete len:94 (+) Transcript_20884:180-461(+)
MHWQSLTKLLVKTFLSLYENHQYIYQKTAARRSLADTSKTCTQAELRNTLTPRLRRLPLFLLVFLCQPLALVSEGHHAPNDDQGRVPRGALAL